jgi:hypothetical protein
VTDKPLDTRIRGLKERLTDELVDLDGEPADPEDVAKVVDSKAGALVDAPVQEFVPLLVEHQSRDELRQHGLHRDFDEPAGDTGADTSESPVELEAEDWPDYGNDPI